MKKAIAGTWCIVITLNIIACGGFNSRPDLVYTPDTTEGNSCLNQCRGEFRSCETGADKGSRYTCKSDMEDCYKRCHQFHGGQLTER